MFFYDPSVVDGTDEDDAARALRDAEETSCCATCFLIDVRKHMVSQKTKLHDTSSTTSTSTRTTKTPVQSAVECLDTFLKNRIISSPNDKVSENLNAPPPPPPGTVCHGAPQQQQPTRIKTDGRTSLGC